ncbi:MAG TPA: GDCCVxC domain-containing (seleno)protein [Gemmatimonadales bacterium]|nr:GDCCVxC domain-containing (seleno)protein [Gemmatimonadales bacterium]
MTESARITCPHCQAVTAAVMPEDACLHFWACPACGRTLTPRAGDCCVFCSHSDSVCPPRRRSTQARV